ncbi:hypothetical protein M9458_000649, partial [Cirrhinus mrigala]
VRGSIQHVEEDNDDEDQAHVYRQKSRVFVSGGGGRARGRWTGHVKMPRRASSSSQEPYSSGKGGWDVLHSIKTSSDCTTQLWTREQTPAR